MNWKGAKLSQLYVIAFDDPMATVTDRKQAADEIARRKQRKRLPRKSNNYKTKAVYV